MPNKHIDEGHAETEQLIKEMTHRLDIEYTNAYKDLEKKVNDFWEDARIRQERKYNEYKEGKITKAEYQDWVNRRLTTGKRWEDMKKTIAEDMTHTNQIASSIVNGYMPEVYAINHNYGLYQIESEIGMGTSLTMYSARTVERLQRENPNLLPKSKVNIKADMMWNKQKMQSAITQGILQGEGIDGIAKRLMRVTDMNRNSAVRNARTMCTSAQSGGRQDAYKDIMEKGVDIKNAWLATLDDRTRQSHRDLDGEAVVPGEKFSNGLEFPGDPAGDPEEVYNCRCTLVPVINGINPAFADLEERSYKLGDMTYEEWKGAKIDAGLVDTPENTVPERELELNQVDIGKANSVGEVNGILNRCGFFTTECNLAGCDLDSAKSVASSYERVFNVYPQIRGKIGGVVAKDLGDNTYACCYLWGNKRVEVNSKEKFYGNFSKLCKGYEEDVMWKWHPAGTTAESVVIHEIGHAIDGLLTDEGVLGAGSGYTPSGKFKFETTSKYMRAKVAQSTGVRIKDMRTAVSAYGGTNEKEWFAECFAEYLTSAEPRTVAKRFGEMLEKLMEEIK